MGRKVSRIFFAASFTICIFAVIPACRKKPAPLDKCGVVDAILNHRLAVPDIPDGRRARPADDHCVRELAIFHGKVLVDASIDGRRIFAPSESCQTFAVYDPSAKIPDPPEGLIVMELAQTGRDAFRWHWWVNSILNPSGGACAPGRGRIEFSKNLGKWETSDVPPQPYVP